MPRKRATRVNQRAKPKKPEGNIGGDLDPEEKRAKLDAFLRDFDMEGWCIPFLLSLSFVQIEIKC